MKLQNVSVSRKLWASTIAILVVMTLAASASLRASKNAMQEALDITAKYDEKIAMAITWRGLTDTNVQRVIASNLAIKSAIPATFGPLVKEGIATISGLQKRISEQATLAQESKAIAFVAERRTVVLNTLKTLDALKSAGDEPALVDAVHKKLMPEVALYLQALDGFVNTEEKLRDEAKALATERSARAELIGLLTMALVFALSLVGVAILVRSISGPLARAVDAAKAIAVGDLTQQLQTTRLDEVGRLMQAMDDMSVRLRGLVTDVRDGVESVSTASAEIATGNMDLSQRTEEQAANLQQTAASMGQLTSTVKQNADNARAASQLAATAAEVAFRGGAVVCDVVSTMEDINRSAKRISDIIAVIDGIAFQTNILALNAAVEAARAGEQGRGFAVVAGEVRSLAQRSAQAAKEIKTLIVESVNTVGTGSRMVSEAGKTMSDIVAQVNRLNGLVGEISAATVEQSRGIEQVGLAVASLDQVTQQNAALVEQSAAAADSMKSQAIRLAESVAVFNIGTSTVPAAASRTPRHMINLHTTKQARRIAGGAADLVANVESDWQSF